MAHGLPPLNWLKAFEASARHLSFTRAAGDLNLTAAAVSHQVRCLEAHLKHPLFERLAHGLRLTEMGAAYLPYVRRAFEDLSVSTARLFDQSGTTILTVRAPVSFVALWLAPRLPSFSASYPAIRFLVLSTLWADAQPDEAVDIDIRFGDGSWPGYRVEPIGRDASIVVCRREIAAHGGQKRRLKEIAEGHLIHVMGHENHWAEVFHKVGLPPPRDQRSLRVDNSVTAIHIAAEGGGAAIVLRPLAERAMRLLPLHSPFRFELPVEQALYLLTPLSRELGRPEALLFKEWLIAGMPEPAEAAARLTRSPARP